MDTGSFLAGFGGASTGVMKEKYTVDTLEKERINKENIDAANMFLGMQKLPIKDRPIFTNFLPKGNVRNLAETANTEMQTAVIKLGQELGVSVEDMNLATPEIINKLIEKKSEVSLDTQTKQKKSDYQIAVEKQLQDNIDTIKTNNLTDPSMQSIGTLQQLNNAISGAISQLDPKYHQGYITHLEKISENINKKIDLINTREFEQEKEQLGASYTALNTKFGTNAFTKDMPRIIAIELAKEYAKLSNPTADDKKADKKLVDASIKKWPDLFRRDMTVGEYKLAFEQVKFEAEGNKETETQAVDMMGSPLFNADGTPMMRKTITTTSKGWGDKGTSISSPKSGIEKFDLTGTLTDFNNSKTILDSNKVNFYINRIKEDNSSTPIIEDAYQQLLSMGLSSQQIKQLMSSGGISNILPSDQLKVGQ